jgi:hypothetical protein
MIGPVVFAPRTQTYATELKKLTIYQFIQQILYKKSDDERIRWVGSFKKTTFVFDIQPLRIAINEIA